MATAGHVDHGKSTLIRALTGIEPDRWAEERRRGLTIDLGFAWTSTPLGHEVTFVDVPGHQRFLGNTLAGLGPAPVVCFVVAADEGWQVQSGDHRDAIAALDIRHGLVVITKTDRAPDRVAHVLAETREELDGTGLRDAPAVAVSAVEHTGLTQLRHTLDLVLAQVPDPDPTDRIRLWVDRSFTIAGAGTVVTGTLAAGTLCRGDSVALFGREHVRTATVRGLQSREMPRAELGPTARVALNLRGVPHDRIHRGDTVVTPDAWLRTGLLDVRRIGGGSWSNMPTQLIAHVGTAAVPVRFRAFGDDHARLTLDWQLPLIVGDRLVLRDPGRRRVVGGALVLDADPPMLRRRGDSAQRAASLSELTSAGDLTAEVARRRAVPVAYLRRLGLPVADPPEEIVVVDNWWVHRTALADWRRRLRSDVEALARQDPLSGGLTRGAATDLLALPDAALLDEVLRGTGLEQRGGRIRLPGSAVDLGDAEPGVAAVEARLRRTPFHAPEAYELDALRLGPRELAAAQRAGRLLRLSDGVVLLPTAPALAMRTLAQLEQPFTTSAARRALDTTRRVAIPLLEHLDGRGWTRRMDAGHRTVVGR